MKHRLSVACIGSLIALLSLSPLAGCAPQATPLPTAAPAPTNTPSPTQTPKVTLYYEENAQVELISPAGTRVLIDVFDPGALSGPATEDDILLTTHGHSDHLSSDFVASFPGQQLMSREGEIALPDVTIRGIASSHSAGEIRPEEPSNTIFIVDMGGLRIVHFGDIGQDQLTGEQLAALGDVDIAITQIANSFSQMDIENKKGFNLMEQVRPKLIIPTHYDTETLEYAIETWKSAYANTNQLTIGRSGLPDETTLLILGQWAATYGTVYNLPAWEAH